MTDTNEYAALELEEPGKTAIDAQTARAWRRRFLGEMPHLADRVVDFDEYAATVPGY